MAGKAMQRIGQNGLGWVGLGSAGSVGSVGVRSQRFAGSGYDSVRQEWQTLHRRN
jgi:hypothetical protein